VSNTGITRWRLPDWCGPSSSFVITIRLWITSTPLFVVIFQQKFERFGWLINGDHPGGDFAGHIRLGGVDGMIIGNWFSLRDVQSVCGVLDEA
jgi:hypothetical protein